MSNLWQDLQWRGLIAQSTDEKVLSDLLNNKSLLSTSVLIPQHQVCILEI